MVRHARRCGFTLVELIIVIVILGILATIAIPQFINSTKDAQVATVSADLAVLRNAVNLYYHQHSSVYPGAKSTDGAGTAMDASSGPAAFISQMTQYTDATGKVSATLDRTNYPYGPYLTTSIPSNPLNNISTVKVLTTSAAIQASDADGSTGWLFNINTGEVRINDSTRITS